MTENTHTTLAGNIVSQMKELVELKDSFKEDQLKFIKGLINPDLTDNELYMFLLYSNKAGLNPFNREVYAIVYGKNTPDRRVNTIVARDGKRRKAYDKGGMEAIDTESIWIREDAASKQIVRVKPWEGGKLWGATCTVTRNGKRYTAIVPLNEYNTGKSVWAGKPETMIKKVAESQALSQAVPELLGIYDESEMATEANGTTQLSLPVSDKDSEPATEAQKETVRILANKNGVEANPDTMTQATAKAFIAGMTQKK